MRERQSERCSNSLHLPAKRPKKIGDPAAAAHTAAPRPGLPAPRANIAAPHWTYPEPCGLLLLTRRKSIFMTACSCACTGFIATGTFGDTHRAVCRMLTHQTGHELRLEVEGQFLGSTVGRMDEEGFRMNS